jgi:hypothetical protein
MLSITWCEGNRGSQVVTGGFESVYAVYHVLLEVSKLPNYQNPEPYFTSIHVYDCSTGCKLDPEAGMLPVKEV